MHGLTEQEIREMVKSLPLEDKIGLAEDFAREDYQSRRNPMLYFKPVPGQAEFLKMLSQYDLIGYFGGNRSGKSMGGAYATAVYLTGKDPLNLCNGLKIPKPKRRFALRETTTLVWIGSQKFSKGVELVEKKLLPLLSPDTYVWRRTEGLLKMNNGAEAQVMSYDQDAEKWASSEVDLIWLDEECPFSIYEECCVRISTRDGKLMNTVTPLNAESVWTYFEFVENMNDKTNIAYIYVNMDDNFYLTDKQKRTMHEAFDKSESSGARLKGIHSIAEGLVHKKFDPKVHVIKPFKIIPEKWISRGWKFGRVFDIHTRNDQVGQWFMYKRDGVNSKFIVFDEISYPSGDTMAFGDVVNDITRKHGAPISKTIIDTPETGDTGRVDPTMIRMLKEKGIVGEPPVNRSVALGINRFNDFLVSEDGEGKPLFQVFDTCRNTIHSIRILQFQNWRGSSKELNPPKEKIVKKDADEVRNLHYISLWLPPVNRAKQAVEMDWGSKKFGITYVRNHQKAG